MITNMKTTRVALILLVGILAAPKHVCAASQPFEVQLKKKWVETYMDRTSITADMTIHHSHQSPNKVGTGSADGDLHFSGEADIVGLPFVAEIVNAASENSAVAFVKKTAKANEQAPKHETSVPVSGAWRLWFEHPSKQQIQGGNNPFVPDSTNPSHSFEIHPVSQIAPPGQPSLNVRDRIVPVENFTNKTMFEAYDAETAFPYFESLTLTIKASATAIAIRSNQLKYNYVKFDFELTQKPKKVQDGYIALARVVGGSAETADLPGQIRLIFVDGTAGADAMSKANTGDSFTVLGVPRLNLNAIDHLVKTNGTAQFTAKLPYEMIIVGVY